MQLSMFNVWEHAHTVLQSGRCSEAADQTERFRRVSCGSALVYLLHRAGQNREEESGPAWFLWAQYQTDLMRVFRQTGSISVHFLLVDLPNARGHRGHGGLWKWHEHGSAPTMPQTQVPHIHPWGIMWSGSGSGGGRGGCSHSFIKHQSKLTTQLQTSNRSTLWEVN